MNQKYLIRSDGKPGWEVGKWIDITDNSIIVKGILDYGMIGAN
jgi:hypothetical protein